MASPTIPGYESLTQIGTGGFSRVYQGEQAKLKRSVAIKVLNFGLNDEADRRSFERECELMGRVSTHPNIVTVHDTEFTTEGHPCIVMEHYPGGSLADFIGEVGQLGVREVLEVGVAIAAALEASHQAKVLHCDLKPQNILISEFGQPALGDFGISTFAEERTYTGSDAGVGFTLAYAAPEILEGASPSVTSDVYSLAATLYTALAGRRPFYFATASGERPAPSEQARRILLETAPPLAEIGVPVEVDRLIASAMAKEPEDRPQSAADFAVALYEVGTELDLNTSMPRIASQAALGGRLPAQEPAAPAPAIIDLTQLTQVRTKTSQVAPPNALVDGIDSVGVVDSVDHAEVEQPPESAPVAPTPTSARLPAPPTPVPADDPAPPSAHVDSVEVVDDATAEQAPRPTPVAPTRDPAPIQPTPTPDPAPIHPAATDPVPTTPVSNKPTAPADAASGGDPLVHDATEARIAPPAAPPVKPHPRPIPQVQPGPKRSHRSFEDLDIGTEHDRSRKQIAAVFAVVSLLAVVGVLVFFSGDGNDPAASATPTPTVGAAFAVDPVIAPNQPSSVDLVHLGDNRALVSWSVTGGVRPDSDIVYEVRRQGAEVDPLTTSGAFLVLEDVRTGEATCVTVLAVRSNRTSSPTRPACLGPAPVAAVSLSSDACVPSSCVLEVKVDGADLAAAEATIADEFNGVVAAEIDLDQGTLTLPAAISAGLYALILEWPDQTIGAVITVDERGGS